MTHKDLLEFHEKCLKHHTLRKVYFEAAESPQWSRETNDREANEKLLRFHREAVEFLKHHV